MQSIEIIFGVICFVVISILTVVVVFLLMILFYVGIICFYIEFKLISYLMYI